MSPTPTSQVWSRRSSPTVSCGNAGPALTPSPDTGTPFACSCGSPHSDWGRPRRSYPSRIWTHPSSATSSITSRRNAVTAPEPEHAPGGDPFLLPLRLVPGAGLRRPVPPHPGHPQQALRAETDRIPHAGGDRRAAGGAGPDDLDRPPGPGPAVGGDPDGAEGVRTHRPATLRRRPGHRGPRPLRGEGQERAVHSAPPGSGRGPGAVAPRVPGRAGNAGIPQQSRRAPESGCRRATGRPPPAKRRTALPIAEAKASDAARASPYRGHATASTRHRSLGHRAVAGARVRGDDPDVSPCRPAAEGRGPFQGDAVGCAAGAVPA